MNIENQIAQMMQEKLSDGTIEKVIEEKLTKCIGECMENMFKWSGPGKELIEKKLQEVMIPAIESHDFSEYTLKLDKVLTEIINNTTLKDNKEILDNFKDLMTEEPQKERKITDIFNEWCSWVEDNVSTNGLEVTYDDGPSYEYVEVKMDVEEIEQCGRRGPGVKVVRFTCEHDEEVNLQFEIYKYDWMKDWEVRNIDYVNYKTLKYMGEMDIMLAKLSRNSTKISIDKYEEWTEILPSKEPEATFS